MSELFLDVRLQLLFLLSVLVCKLPVVLGFGELQHGLIHVLQHRSERLRVLIHQ